LTSSGFTISTRSCSIRLIASNSPSCQRTPPLSIFLLPIWKKPIFGNNWVEVTRKAADQMATVFKGIVARCGRFDGKFAGLVGRIDAR
jgi:hypothetical protein